MRTILAMAMMAGAAWAGPPSLVLPVDCQLGTDCFLQQFVDHDPGPGAEDFACAGATYDGHKGTDVRVRGGDAARGVAVLAPADGVVTGRRDGMADRIAETAADRAALNGRDCGNGVVIDHGDGWESQLCHMARGSVSVQPGDRVRAGDAVGRVGLSGNTQFHHLHLSLRRDGAVVDPFAPDQQPGACATAAHAAGLWADPDVAAQAARITRLLSAGLADRGPELDAVLDGAFDAPGLGRQAPLVVWAVVINTRTNDRLLLKLDGPDGAVVNSAPDPFDRPQAQAFRFAGLKPPAGGWPAGEYRWQVVVQREGEQIDSLSGSFTLR